MEILLWAMFVRFSRRVSQLLEIKTLRLLEWNLFFPCIPEVFGSPLAYKQHMVFTQESYGKSKKHRTQPRDLGYLGVRVSAWLMANAKQYLIWYVEFVPSASDEILWFSVAPQTKETLRFESAASMRKKWTVLDAWKTYDSAWNGRQFHAIFMKHDFWWWFQKFFIFTPIWGRFPFWRIFFGWVGNHQPGFVVQTGS